MRMRFLPLLALVAVGLAHADPASDLVAKMAQPGGRIVKEFDTTTGLKGFVVEHVQSKKTALIYVDPAGRFLLSGLLFDGQGANLSQAHVEQHVPKPDHAAILKDAETTAWIEDGKADAKAVIYVLGEPNCVYCKVFYAQTREAVAKGELALRWIMIGFDADGAQKAASLYSAGAPGRALYDFYSKSPAGQAAPTPFIGASAVGPRTEGEQGPQVIARNQAYAAKHGLGGTPHLVYRTRSGAVQASPGVPQPQAMAEILAVAAR